MNTREQQISFARRELFQPVTNTIPSVRCDRNFKLLGMFDQKCQMSVHQGSKPPNVIHQVSSHDFLERSFCQRAKRQVQDLQSQLAEARHHISQLDAVLRERGISESTARRASSPILKLPDIAHKPTQKPMQQAARNFAHVRRNIQMYGRGIFKPPSQFRQASPLPAPFVNPPALPSKRLVERLLTQYYTCIHTITPAIHWSNFHSEVEAVYAQGNLNNVPSVWVALFFAVLACGTLQSPGKDSEVEGEGYIKTAFSGLQIWGDDFTLDHARASLLLSVYLHEIGLKSAASIWLGVSVRMAEDLGIQCDMVAGSTMEKEASRRTWWAIFTWDR